MNHRTAVGSQEEVDKDLVAPVSAKVGGLDLLEGDLLVDNHVERLLPIAVLPARNDRSTF